MNKEKKKRKEGRKEGRKGDREEDSLKEWVRRSKDKGQKTTQHYGAQGGEL